MKIKYPNNVIGGDADDRSPLSEQLAYISEEIIEYCRIIPEYIDRQDYTEARNLMERMMGLDKAANAIKLAIKGVPITMEDVEALRSIEPHRKSVQNMTDPEVSRTIKFEYMLTEEMGPKSAYEMRKKGGNAWREDEGTQVQVVRVDKREIPDLLTALRKDTRIQRGTFINHDTGIEVIYGGNSIDEIVAKAIPDDKRGSIPVEARIAALYQMQDVIENAICFDSQISEYNDSDSKNKSKNTLFMHRMYGIMEYKGAYYLTNLGIEEMYTTDKEEQSINGTINRLYSFRDIQITPVELLGFEAHASLHNADTDTLTGAIWNISIAQLYKLVKAHDELFFENQNAAGRAERLEEIQIKERFEEAMKNFNAFSSGENDSDYGR